MSPESKKTTAKPEMNKAYTSDIDRWLQQYHATQPKTPSEQAEANKAQRIADLRDRS